MLGDARIHLNNSIQRTRRGKAFMSSTSGSSDSSTELSSSGLSSEESGESSEESAQSSGDSGESSGGSGESSGESDQSSEESGLSSGESEGSSAGSEESSESEVSTESEASTQSQVSTESQESSQLTASTESEPQSTSGTNSTGSTGSANTNSSSSSDPACAIQKIVIDGTDDEGPGFRFINTSITLRAKSDPKCASGNIAWTITQQPSGSSVANPANGTTATITPTHLGKYVIKATCGNSNDTFDLYCYQIEFEKDTSTHLSTEGHPAGGGVEYLSLPSPYWSYIGGPTDNSFVASSATLHLAMATDDVAYIAAKGAGSWLQPSGEIRYDFFLNFGNASANVKMSIEMSASGTVGPLSTLIKRGASAYCRYYAPPSPPPPPIFSFSVAMKSDGSGVIKSETGQNPLIFSGTISGRTLMGKIEAGVSYANHGVSNGAALNKITASFSVQKP